MRQYDDQDFKTCWQFTRSQFIDAMAALGFGTSGAEVDWMTGHYLGRRYGGFVTEPFDVIEDVYRQQFAEDKIQVSKEIADMIHYRWSVEDLPGFWESQSQNANGTSQQTDDNQRDLCEETGEGFWCALGEAMRELNSQ